MRLMTWLRSSPSRFASACRAARPSTARLGFESLEDRTVPTTFTVNTLSDSGDGSLRAAVLAANANPGADVIAFEYGLRGTVALTSGELTITDGIEIKGPGATKLAVSGSDVSRVFRIGGGVIVSIDGLTITHGRAIGQGGGILNAGNLTLSRSVLSDNLIVGAPGASLGTVVDAFGGGVFNAGSLTVRGSSFLRNQSIGADGSSSTIGSSALGGAIMSIGISNTVSNSIFVENRAVGGSAGIGASRAGIGGAISNGAGTLTVTQSAFRDNEAVGGIDNGVAGGFGTGAGGAIGNVARAANSILVVSDSTFLSNRAVGGAASLGGSAQDGRGGAIANYIFGGLQQPVTVSAIATVTGSTLLGNQAIGGTGSVGGIGQGGGIANLNGGVLTVSNSLIALNRALGGAGINGGDGQGGGIFSGGTSPVGTPTLLLDHSLISLNRAEGGAANGGSAGQGFGGGLYIGTGGIASADPWTWIFANDATTSDDNIFGILV